MPKPKKPKAVKAWALFKITSKGNRSFVSAFKNVQSPKVEQDMNSGLYNYGSKIIPVLITPL